MVDAYRVVPSGYVSYNSKDSFTRKVSGEALDAGCTPAIRVVSRLGEYQFSVAERVPNAVQWLAS